MLEVNNLCKNYPSFRLKDVSFSLSPGYIMGFIGKNGAGKTTTLKSLLNLVKPDSGSVRIFGKDMYTSEIEVKQDIGFMLGPLDYYARHKVKLIADVYGRFFHAWDATAFSGYLKRFGIDARKRITELSAGMKVKLGVAMALSHNARLLILDEPTSGLDPVARDDLLDVLREVVSNGERSVLFSTHITSDLDKCADYIIFIRDGDLIASDTKDDLIEKHVLVSGKTAGLTESLKARLIGIKTNAFGWTGLALRERLEREVERLETATPNLEDLMVYYNKEESL